MWWGENGDRWILEENGKQIYLGSLTRNGQTEQNGTYTLSGKQNGTYSYVVKLCNGTTCNASTSKTVTVQSASISENVG